MSDDEHIELLVELLKHERETEWLEFKLNNSGEEEIGEYISALSNSAALECKPFGYVVWGVSDPPEKKFVGTTFSPGSAKRKGEEIEHWLTRSISPQIDFRFREFAYDGKKAVILEIPAATHAPVLFKNTGFIRVGSYKKKLQDNLAKQRSLWKIFCSSGPFERGTAQIAASLDDVLSVLDASSFFELLKLSVPDRKAGYADVLVQEEMILRKGDGRYDITNFGALLFAKDLNKFSTVKRKGIRVIVYPGTQRTESAVLEKVEYRGYACGFTNAVKFITEQLRSNEHIESALRRNVPVYPEIAIRELLANILIHQDLDATGTGPLVEIFTDRIEMSNPGIPLIDTKRFIDTPPQSRNENLASFMRRIGICEERGGGIDKVVEAVELFQLPPPEFRATDNHTVVSLYGPRSLSGLTQEERIRACYHHACLQWVARNHLTNASLRKRLGIDDRNYSMASRIISDAIDQGFIRVFDPTNASKKHARYVPFWA